LKTCAFSKASPNPAISLFAQQTYTLLFAININNISYFRKRSNIDRREIAIFQISRHIYRDAAPVSAPARELPLRGVLPDCSFCCPPPHCRRATRIHNTLPTLQDAIRLYSDTAVAMPRTSSSVIARLETVTSSAPASTLPGSNHPYLRRSTP
jgi:hypothetical protein